jgi:hypothetical protein
MPQVLQDFVDYIIHTWTKQLFQKKDLIANSWKNLSCTLQSFENIFKIDKMVPYSIWDFHRTKWNLFKNLHGLSILDFT